MNEVRHRTGGGRSARMAARTGEGARPHAPAFIRREIPPYELLGEEGLALIETNADRILADVGIEIRDDPEALQLFKDAGASVDGITRPLRSRTCARRCARPRPRQFTQLARNPARSVEIGGDNVVLAPTYGSPFVRDLAGGRRYALTGRLPELRQADVRHAVAASQRRHGVRARRRAGQQASSRHGVRPPSLQRQGVHGVGHAPDARRRLDRDGSHRLRRRRRREQLRHHGQRQRQLTARVGCDHDRCV